MLSALEPCQYWWVVSYTHLNSYVLQYNKLLAAIWSLDAANMVAHCTLSGIVSCIVNVVRLISILQRLG